MGLKPKVAISEIINLASLYLIITGLKPDTESSRDYLLRALYLTITGLKLIALVASAVSEIFLVPYHYGIETLAMTMTAAIAFVSCTLPLRD